MKTTLLVLCLVLSSAIAFENARRYEGYQVWSLQIDTMTQADEVYKMVDAMDPEVTFWTENLFVPGVWDVQFAPQHLHLLQKTLAVHEIHYSVLHEDLKANIEAHMTDVVERQDASFFESYQDYASIMTFLEELNQQYSSITELVVVGQTLEGRNITGIKISGSGEWSSKPAIVFNGCQHAREWLSPMTVCYIAQSLVANYSTSTTVQSLVDAFEWTIIPVVNADGYNYTWTNDRMWRKNRRQNEGSPCYGVDNNRNWDYEWGGAGASSNPCSDTYRGTAGFSEPEETAVANYISANGRVQYYIDFHMYGNLFMYPWGYTCTQKTANNVIQQDGADDYAAAVFATHGEVFTTGSVCTTIYAASGGSNDWTYGVPDAVYSYACELRGNSFLEPATQILPSGQEQFNGIIALAQFVQSNPYTPY